MKAYFLNRDQIARIIEVGRSNRSNFYVSDGDLADLVAKELEAEPIELDEVAVAGLPSACRYYPKEHIIGFTQKDGDLKGVFIKED